MRNGRERRTGGHDADEMVSRSTERVDGRAIERVLVISKKSAYEQYVRRHKMARVKELLRAKDPVVANLQRADLHHGETLEEVRDVIAALGLRARFRDRSQVGTIEGFDLVITVGGDGTMLSTSHSVAETPMFGINSAPVDSVGFLCSARRGNVRERLEALLAGKLTMTRLARMRVTVDGDVAHTRVLNDCLYAHKNPAMTARYFLRFRGVTEEQKSSGIWIGPPAGSTAAIRSAGGRKLTPKSRLIQFVVREPYKPDGGRYSFQHGLVSTDEKLEVWNKMREAALYIDGPRTVVPLEIGQRVTFDLSPETLNVIGFAPGSTSLHSLMHVEKKR
jgi:NAD+ kinase